jgi:hypothetical protein
LQRARDRGGRALLVLLLLRLGLRAPADKDGGRRPAALARGQRQQRQGGGEFEGGRPQRSRAF